MVDPSAAGQGAVQGRAKSWGRPRETQVGGTEASEEEARSLQEHRADGPHLPRAWGRFTGERVQGGPSIPDTLLHSPETPAAAVECHSTGGHAPVHRPCGAGPAAGIEAEPTGARRPGGSPPGRPWCLQLLGLVNRACPLPTGGPAQAPCGAETGVSQDPALPSGQGSTGPPGTWG